MADDVLSKLRSENASLINELKDGVLKLQLYADRVSSDLATHRPRKGVRYNGKAKLDVRAPFSLLTGNKMTPDARETSKTLPINSKYRQKRIKNNGKQGSMIRAVTSTPLVSKTMLESEGNLRCRPKLNMVSSDTTQDVEGTRKLEDSRKPKSILVMPAERKTPKQGRHKVFFPDNCIDTQHFSEDGHRSFGDKSLLGYDWIAGILDNENNEHAIDSDRLIEEINEFRRVNREECSSNRAVFESFTQQRNYSDVKAPDEEAMIGKDNDSDFCCGSTYTVDSRLLPVPIHGPNSQCPICLIKPAAESEYAESYIRVSVPRSSLKSPYRLRPHRRKSFDPSDSVALSEHCLAGWQCARPSYAPGPDTVDIKSSINTVKKFLPTGINDLKASYHGDTNELLNKAAGMNYGLQLLDDTGNMLRKAHTESRSVPWPS